MSSALDQLRQLQGGFDSQADEISDMINERSSAFSNAWRSKANEAMKLKDDAKEQLDELLATGVMGAQQAKGLYDRVKTVRANRAAIRAGTKSADIKPAAEDDDFVSPEEGVGDDDPLFSDQGLGQRGSAIVGDDERENLSSLSRTARAAEERAAASRGAAPVPGSSRAAAAEDAAPAESVSSSSSKLATIPEEAEDESATSSLFGDSAGGFTDAYRGDQFRRMGFGQPGSGGWQRQPDVLERQMGSGPVQSSFSQAEDDPTAPDGTGSAVARKTSQPQAEDDDAEAGASEAGASEAGASEAGASEAGADTADIADTAATATEGAEVGSSVALGAGTETAIGLAGDVLGPVGLLAGIGLGIFEAIDSASAKPHDPPPQEAVSTAVSRHSLVLPSIDGVVDTPASMSAF